MIVHRMSTHTPEPPVKFYKLIALSFLFITIILLGVVIFVTSKKASIVVYTKQDTENVTLSLNVGQKTDNSLEGKVTSTFFVHAENYQPTGNKKIDGVSEGEVVIYNTTNAPQALVRTTRLVTKDGVLFRMSKAAVVPANGQVVVPVYADQKGSSSDIGPSDFTIPGLNQDKQKAIFAKSTSAMKGGERTAGILNSDDIANAKESYIEKVKDEFLRSLPAAEEGVERIVSISDQSVLVDKKAGEEVDNFVLSGTSTIVLVEFKNKDLEDLVNKEAGSKIDTSSERFLSLSAKPKVEIKSFDGEKGTALLNVKQQIAVTLDANNEKLSPSNFFGKKKEEIERYVLTLDHVAGVEVKFTPSWIFTAPTVENKFSVIVNIK